MSCKKSIVKRVVAMHDVGYTFIALMFIFMYPQAGVKKFLMLAPFGNFFPTFKMIDAALGCISSLDTQCHVNP